MRPETTSQIVRWRRGDPRLRPSRRRDAPRDCFDLLLDYHRCLRSPFLLLQSRDSFGHVLRNGARPFGSAPIGNITSHVQWGTLPTRGDRKSPTASRKLATRPTRPRTAGIQTYPLTWVPAGHSEHSHSGRRGRELPVSKLIHREALRRALALQPSVGRPKQPHPSSGHLSRHPSPQPHAILGEGPSSIVSTHQIQSGIRKCCIFGFSAVFFPRRFTKRALSE